MMRHYLCRKELARMYELTVAQIRKNEKRWGLEPQRVNRNVRYDRKRVILAFARMGLQPISEQ